MKDFATIIGKFRLQIIGGVMLVIVAGAVVSCVQPSKNEQVVHAEHGDVVQVATYPQHVQMHQQVDPRIHDPRKIRPAIRLALDAMAERSPMCSHWAEFIERSIKFYGENHPETLKFISRAGDSGCV